MTVRIGSCFAGIGGWELGLERAIPNSHTIWQVEQNTFCQSILKKHWPNATIFDDVRTVGAHNLEKIDLLCAGFPCQDLSMAGQKRGIYDGEKSSLFWQLHRIISELRPRIICLENVANIIRLGGTDVVGSLAQIGYDCEWTVIRSGADFGAPHERKRWFCVAYPTGIRCRSSSNHEQQHQHRIYKQWDTTQSEQQRCERQLRISQDNDAFASIVSSKTTNQAIEITNSNLSRHEKQHEPIMLEQRGRFGSGDCKDGGIHIRNYWQQETHPPRLCSVDDGIPNRLAKLRALGNAIVPQASEWIGHQIVQSGLIDDLIH